MQAIILAAGKGARLHPYTQARSKAMMPVVGRPMVERVMEGIAAGGIDRFVVVVGPDDDEIHGFFAAESKFHDRVTMVVQHEPLGMADALGRAAPMIDGDFVLSACDNLVDPADIGRLIDVWRGASGLTAILTLMPVDDRTVSRVGVVELAGDRVTRIVEKPKLSEAPSKIASLPLYVFSRAILKHLTSVPLSPRGERELQDAIQYLIECEGGVRGFRVQGRLTLTSPSDLIAINRHYLERQAPDHPASGRIAGHDAELIAPVCVEDGVSIGRGCIIGPNVYVEQGCRIGDRVTVRDSVLLRQASISDGSTIVGQVVA